MPTLTVLQPPANLKIKLNVPFQVTGQATDVGPPEPKIIDTVTVQVDNGPAIRANLTRIPDKNVSKISFNALAEVTGGQDPHVVTVVATNDNGQSVKRVVNVFTGPAFEVSAPSIIIDINTLLPVTADDPRVVRLVKNTMASVGGFADSLASIGKMLVGPNVLATTNADGLPILRIGIWIEDPGFPVIPAGHGFAQPRLVDLAASLGFALTPILAVPGPPPSFSPPFAISIPISTLQRLMDAITPSLQSAASQNHVSLDTVTVYANPPASITTSFVGSLPLGIPFTASITESLGTKLGPDPSAQQHVPAVVGSSSSASAGSLFDWLVSGLIPYARLALLAALYKVVSATGDSQDQVNGIFSGFVDSIPSRFPVRNTDLPLPVIPDFPVLIPDWQTFGVTGDGIFGAAFTSIAARDQSMVAMSLSGPRQLSGYSSEVAGGVRQNYRYSVTNLVPDSDQFKWKVTGFRTASGDVPGTPLGQSGVVTIDFPLPLPAPPAIHPYTVTLAGVETCGTDSTKTMSATVSEGVKLTVLPDPKEKN